MLRSFTRFITTMHTTAFRFASATESASGGASSASSSAAMDILAALQSGEGTASTATLMRRSDVFHNIQPFKTVAGLDNRIKALVDKGGDAVAREVESHADMVRPFAHRALIPVMEEFIQLKKTQGTPAERTIFAGMGWREFVQRCLVKRPVVFFMGHDHFVLPDGRDGAGGFETLSEKAEDKLSVHKFISYDEMVFSSMLSVSVPTHFINNGARNNCGRAAPSSSNHVRHGYYVASVGARFGAMMLWSTR